MVVEQYQVYWVNLDPTIGMEIKKIRPCVVISPNELNKYLGTVIIAPVTSKLHGYPYRVECEINGRRGEIVTDQIRTVDKSRLKSCIGKLLLTVSDNLRDVLVQMFS